jgi:uncharacterized protein YqjF (DUF2071 family)
VVPFWMDHIRLRGLPEMPGSHRFAELNLRTYVRSRETMVPGVYFVSLDAANPLAVLAARSWFRLPYFWASMQHEEKSDGLVHYSSRRLMTRKPVRFKAKYRGLGRPPSGMAPMQEIVNGQVRVRYAATPGSLEHFLVERYCLFTRWGNDVRMSNIHHSPWPLEEAEAEIEMNELPESFGIELPRRAPIVHYSRELAVYVWAPEAVGERAPMGAVPA